MSRSKEEKHKITIFYPFCSTPIKFVCPSDGTLNGDPCQGQQPPVSLDFVEELTREGRQGNFKTYPFSITNSCRRYMAKILASVKQ